MKATYLIYLSMLIQCQAWFGRKVIKDLPPELDDEEIGDNDNFFQPISGTTVNAPCSWEIKVSSLPDRIPSQITEIHCKHSGTVCGANVLYECKQLSATLEVAYISSNSTDCFENFDNFETEIVHFRRNITIGVGCACVQRQPYPRKTFSNFNILE